MKRRLTPRGQERRRQLMDYATSRFSEQGYHPTSVAEIVSGLGVGKGVFYWYFDSKEELFFEILREAQLDLRRSQKAAMEQVGGAVARIELGIRASMHWASDHRDVHKLFQFAATEERFAPALRKGGEVAAGDIIRIVKDGIAEGTLRDSDPVILAHAILGTSTYLARVFVHEQEMDPDRVAEEAIAFCLDGILVPQVSRAVPGR